MTSASRLNGVIRAWESGKPAFASFASADRTTAIAFSTSPYDGLVFEMEHNPWDPNALQDALQYLLNRAQIAKSGSVAPALRLVDAVAEGRITAAEIDPATREALRRLPDPTLRARVESVLKSAPEVDRREVVRRYQPALSLGGDISRGRALFEKYCMTCHARDGRGAKVGPDLLTVAVFDAPVFDRIFSRLVTSNDEGRLLTDDLSDGATTGFPFNSATIERFVTAEPIQPAGAALLRTAWQHRAHLLIPSA